MKGEKAESQVNEKRQKSRGGQQHKKWHQFQVTSEKRAVLHGSTSTNDRRYKPLSRGRQASAASVVALVYAQLFAPQDWSPSFIDRVIEYGDRLYRMSRARAHLGDDVYVTAGMLQQEFFVGDYKCRICTEPGAVYGPLFVETAGAPNLADGLRKFFEVPGYGVLTAQGISVAIWHHPQHGFFYFDPAPVNEQGDRCPTGFACLLRSTDLDELKNVFLKNLNNKCDSRYCIDRIRIIQIKLIGHGKYQSKNAEDITIDKNVLKMINPVDLENAKQDCTKLIPKGDVIKKETLSEAEEPYHKIPLNIEITNCMIEKKLASMPLADQFLKDEKYSYEETRANIPETFQPVPNDPKLVILHGWTHQNSDVYKAKGAQTAANCIMAIAMKTVNPVKSWLRKSLDDVLTMGDALYSEIKAIKPNIKNMSAVDLDDAQVKIENRKLIIDVEILTVIGTVVSKIPTVLNLKQGVEEFFQQNTDGILECCSITVAIWSENNYYYMFDPRSCDINGILLKQEKTKEKKGKGGASPFERKVVGKCCIIRFPDINSLSNHFLKNLDLSNSNDRYTISRVSIIDYVPGIRDWNAFKPGGLGKSWILRGTMNRDDNSFSEHSRNVQGLAMPVVALVSAKTITPAEWSSEEIDETIQYGDDYYNWCIPFMGEMENEDKELTFKNLKKYLYYKNCKASIEIKESCVIGDLKKSIDDDNVLNLEHGIIEFFKDHQFGIIEANNKFFAIWKFEEELRDKSKEISYYLFNDKPSEEFWKKIPLKNIKYESHACLLRFLDPQEIAVLLKRELENEEEENRSDFFIHDVTVSSISAPMTNEEIEQDKAMPIKPDLRAYSVLHENGAVLNGSFNQANETIFKKETRDKQQAANALISLAMTKLYYPHLWYGEVLDDILKMGDKLTAKNLNNISQMFEADEEPRKYLLPAEIEHEFLIGLNEFTIEVEEEATSGNLNDINKTLEDFFGVKKMGIFRMDEIMYPIWKEDNVYFMMDPRGKNNNSAAVYWLLDTQLLGALIQECIEKSEGDFVIDAITVEMKIAETQKSSDVTITENNWYNFAKIEDGIWKIDCNISMENEKFEEENKGKQSAAICIMAIVFSKIYEPRHLTTEILDEITVTGDKLHIRSVARLGENKSFHPKEIISEFFISNRRIGLTIQDCVEAGTFGGRPPKIQDLLSGILNFFKISSAGCLTLFGQLNVAIWTFDGCFYYLDPGIALMRYENINSLVEELQKKYDSDTDFEITSVDIIDWNKLPPWKYDPSPAVRPSNLPSLNAYCKLPGKARAILRGYIHQSSKIFPDDIRNRQTASNCIICLAMSVIKNPITWTRKTLDEILALGINLHRESLKYTSNTTKMLKLKDIIRIFQIGINVLSVDVEKATITGIVAHSPPEPEEKGKKRKKSAKKKPGKDKKKKAKRMPPPPPPPILLEEGLNKFFESNNAGILSTGHFMIAIWKESGVYFMYDPCPRNNEGLKMEDEREGTSCVVWFACTEPLFHLISANLNDDEKYAPFEICKIIIRTVPIEPLPSPAKYKSTNERPQTQQTSNTSADGCRKPAILPADLQLASRAGQQPKISLDSAFERIDAEVSVLRGTIRLDDDTHFGPENRGFQSSAVSLAALVIAALHAPPSWTPELVDAVLRHGDALHTECARLARPGARNLSPGELLELFVVGDVRARVRLHTALAAGLSLQADLAASLELFFTAGRRSGIFHTASIALPLIEHSGKYYALDPGVGSGLGGSACLLKCASVAGLARAILRVCSFDEPTLYTLCDVQVLDLFFFAR